MDMNRMISKAGSLIVTVTVFLFAVFLLIDFSMGSFFVGLILPIGFIMMTEGLNLLRGAYIICPSEYSHFFINNLS